MQTSHDEFLSLHWFHKVKSSSKITNHSGYSMAVTAARTETVIFLEALHLSNTTQFSVHDDNQ